MTTGVLPLEVGSDPKQSYFESDHLPEDLHERAFSGGVLTLGVQGFRAVSQIFWTVALSRLLIPQDFGLIAMAIAITGFVPIFRDLGLANATVQRLHITHDQVSTLFWINAALGAGVMLVVAASSPLVAWFYHEPRLIWVTVALSVNFLLGGLTVQHQALLKRQMRFEAIAMLDSIAVVVWIATGVSMALLGFRYWSLVGAQFGQNATYCILIWLKCRWRPGPFQRNVGVRPMLAFGGNVTGFQLLNYFTRNSDNIIIGRVLGAAALGLYSRAYGMLMLPVYQVNMPVAAVLLPSLSRLQNKPLEYAKLFLRAVRAINLISVPIIVFFFVFAREIVVLLLGTTWLPVAHLFRLLTPAAMASATVFAPHWLSQSLGRPQQQMHYGIVSAPICVGGFVIGVRWGVQGVAASFSATFVVLVAAYAWYATRKTAVNLSDLVFSFWSAFWPACVAGIFAFTLNQVLLGQLSLSAIFAVCAALFWLAYVGIVMLSKSSRAATMAAIDAVRAKIRRKKV